MTYPDGTAYTETDTRTKLVNPALYDAGWNEDHIQRERSPGTILFYNDFTGITLDIDLINFPSPADLRQIYEEKTGIHLDSVEALPSLMPYRGGQSARRYYQDAAIRAAFEKIAQGGRRLLISMATGTGKTLTAVHLLHRLAQARQLRKVLFLCDRTSLAEQAHATLSRFFGDDAQIVSGKNPRKNAHSGGDLSDAQCRRRPI